MRVVVLGAGVIGVTTAWALASFGHDVTVVERHASPALETSFANGGQLSVSHAEPWANPRAPLQILKWMGDESAPLLWRMRADAAQWAWGCRFLLECLPQRSRRNARSLLALGLYSRGALAELRGELSLNYHQLQRGILHFYTNERDFAYARRETEHIVADGGQRLIKSARECLEIEPALSDSGQPIVGGTYAVADESGDAHLFSQALSNACIERGVRFKFGVTAADLEYHLNRIVGVKLGDGEVLDADAVVVALGSQSAPFLRARGLRFPIFPLKGYSASLLLPAHTAAPFVSLTDEAHKLVFSRLGNTLRVAGTAEFAGHDASINVPRCEAIMQRVKTIFPGLSRLDGIEYWAGLRPATPGNVPFVGATTIPNLWLNSGHGTLGWTLACGSAKLLAQLISKVPPGMDPSPFRADLGA